MTDPAEIAYRTAVTGTNSTMADPMRSWSINPITPSMFRSARSRTRPPSAEDNQELGDAHVAIVVDVE